MAKLYVIGIGPGSIEHMTLMALKAIKKSQIVVGYSFYIDILKDILEEKKVISTGMREEIERCKIAIEKVREGFDTSIISTGDAGLYGMAGPILELASGIEVEVIPGVTSSFAAASEIGAPIMHDFCTISLSDLLTPCELIEKRIECAAKGDFVIAIYNPRSKGREDYLKNAVGIIMKYKDADTPVGIVKNAGREGRKKLITTLSNINYDFVDMKTVVIIGNKETYIKNGKIITPRGYKI
ncbi:MULTISPECIES: precorrin-3B C(17)-methyltransferase [Clostridium]|uniref:precorrin-3B C(17)-methyltransferase n=1 Tax=Clostridium TaxID=1485 RepID=UPI00069DE0B3|nr:MULTISPECIES: precorrin-3B C(17)-methyltransferase [Clostridium]KOF57093.1 cobalt-precorrin-3B C(17)-methyltransferase [Clostridium sp. DMHC 10]MCD2348501.1 precorrin-3B C(17)-methyltransferase [Clostridium guangxiense]